MQHPYQQQRPMPQMEQGIGTYKDSKQFRRDFEKRLQPQGWQVLNVSQVRRRGWLRAVLMLGILSRRTEIVVTYQRYVQR